jgi:hypothetical protein
MLFAAVAPVFFIVATGFLVRRLGVLSAVADATLLRVCVNVLYPALILATIVGNPALREGSNVWLSPLTGFGLVTLGYLVSAPVARFLRLKPEADTRTFIYVSGLYNYGYVAIPLIDKLFGAKTLGVVFTHNLGVEFAFWLGASAILAPRHATDGTRASTIASWWRPLLNAPVIAILVALALNAALGGNAFPAWLHGGFKMLGAATIPLALLLTGATMADYLAEFRTAHSGWRPLLGATLLRLALLPPVFIALAKALPCSIELKQVLVVQAAMPSAMLPILLAKHHGGNVGMAVQIVFLTTLLSILTIPFWIHAGMHWVGL